MYLVSGMWGENGGKFVPEMDVFSLRCWWVFALWSNENNDFRDEVAPHNNPTHPTYPTLINIPTSHLLFNFHINNR